jgi:hypothetical protein
MDHSNRSPSRHDERLFDLSESASSSEERIRELKRMLFDLSYLVVNVDGTEHISEQMLLTKLEQRMEREGSVDPESRAQTLQELLDDGRDAIRARVETLADEVAERAGDRARELGARYLDFLGGLIVSDANVDPAEYELYDRLCSRWGVENTLPES